MRNIYVDKNGDGDFTSIQAAIDDVRVHPLEPVTIFIKAGIYHEKVVVPDNKPDIHLIGENTQHTIISNHVYANMLDSNKNMLGTFQTPTVSILADNIKVENLTIENTAGFGPKVGQALALYVSGDRGIYKNIRLLGNQDTLYSCRGRQYFIDCYIEGHVDFIFGSGTVVFTQCEIHSLREGYITAASTPKDIPYGFIFFDCKLTGSAKENTVFLGRPWRPYAHTLFIRTEMGKHIKQEGWDNWRNPENEKTARYAEYDSSGPGATKEHRVIWATTLSRDEVDRLTLEQIFHGRDGWIPSV